MYYNFTTNITNIALDRIQNITVSKLKFIPNDQIDFSDYFEDVIGVSVDPDQDPFKVILKVDSDLLPYWKFR